MRFCGREVHGSSLKGAARTGRLSLFDRLPCQAFRDRIHVEDAAAPGAAAGVLQEGPEAGGGGELGVGAEVFADGTGGESGIPRGEIHGAFQVVAIDHDFDEIAFAKFADGATGEGFGGDVADARAGGDAAETGVGEHGDVFTEGRCLSAAVIW